MAYEQSGFVLGTLLAPSTAYYAYQYRGVAASTVTEGYIAMPSTAKAATNAFLGILQNKPKYTGAASEVMVSGVSKVRCGANSSNIGIGEYVMFKNDGLAYASSNLTKADIMVGPVLSVNTGTTGLITVVLDKRTYYST